MDGFEDLKGVGGCWHFDTDAVEDSSVFLQGGGGSGVGRFAPARTLLPTAYAIDDHGITVYDEHLSLQFCKPSFR